MRLTMLKRALAVCLSASLILSNSSVTAFADEFLYEDNGEISLDGDSFENISDFVEELEELEEDTAEHYENNTDSSLSFKGDSTISRIFSEQLDNSIAKSDTNITDIVVEYDNAIVEYQTNEDAKIIVALYDENTEKMTAVGVSDVDCDSDEVIIDLQGSVPDYFVAKAFCVSLLDNSPLCPAYTNELYTKELRELVESDINDYDSELVVNLDTNDESNFAVYNEDVIQQISTDSENTIENNDQGKYIINNATQEVKELKNGDIVSFVTADEEIVVINVESIIVSGDEVTINEDENVSLTDVFDYIKIDSLEETNDENNDVDLTDVEEGITYNGTTDVEFHDEIYADDYSSQEDKDVDTDVTIKKGLSFGIDKTIKDNKNGKTVKFTGSVGIALTVKVRLYATLTRQYASVSLETTENFTCTLSGSASAEYYLGELKLPCVVTGVYAHAKCYAYINATGKAKFKCEIKSTLSAKLDAQNGSRDLSKKPECGQKPELELSGSLEVGVKIEMGFEFIDSQVAEINQTGKVGIEIEAKLDPKSSDHNCTGCFKGTINGLFSVGLNAKLIKIVKMEVTLSEVKSKISDFYICGEHNRVGLSKCPYKNDKDFEVTKTFSTQSIGDILRFTDITVLLNAVQTKISFNDFNYNCPRGKEYRLDFYDSNNKCLFYVDGVSQGGTYEGHREDYIEGYSTKPQYKNVTNVKARLCDNGMSNWGLFSNSICINETYLPNEDGISHTIDNLAEGKEYIVAVVKENDDDPLWEDNILYINQAVAKNGKIELNINKISDEIGYLVLFEAYEKTMDTPMIKADRDMYIENDDISVEPGAQLYLYNYEFTGADIYYTLDGSNPKENGILFDNENPIIVTDKGYKIKAYATDEVLGDSEVVVFYVNYDHNLDDIGDKGKDDDSNWINVIKHSENEYTLNLASKEKYLLTDLAKEKTDGKKYKIAYASKADNKVASITAMGLITAKKPGISHINLNKGGVDYKITVNVLNPQFKYENPKNKYFTVNAGSTVIPTYEDCRLKPTFTLDKNSIKKGLATINPETGEVTSFKKGTVKVTAIVGGEQNAKYARKVTTTVKIYDPVINTGKKNTVMVGKTLKAKVKNGVKLTTDWKSSNDAIATVDSKGVIRGISVGKVVITCVNNGKTISKEIEVAENPRLK